MSFFKKIKGFALPAIGAIIGSAVPGVGTALGAAIGSGASSYSSNHNIGQALAAGAGSYIGGQVAGNVLGNTGTVGGALFDHLPGGELSSFAQNVLPSALANTSIGSALGSQIGSNVASNAFAPTQTPSGPTPFSPQQEAQQDTPASLNGIGSLTSDQQSTNLANQGVYGGGNGPQEQSYFENLINRRLVDPSGQTQDMSSLKPIEQSYLQKLGFGGYGDTSSLLEALSKWKQQQATA